MRTLLLLSFLVCAGCGEGAGNRLSGARATDTPPSTVTHWQFAESSQYHGYLTRPIMDLVADDPAEVATQVCNNLGGTLEMLDKPRGSRLEREVICLFREPDLSMAVVVGHVVPSR